MTDALVNAEKEARLTIVESLLQEHLNVGDTITHTRCMGCLEEHLYTGRDGVWLCGKPTRETVRLGGSTGSANDIHPRNVTHINRVPIDSVPFLAKVAPK